MLSYMRKKVKLANYKRKECDTMSPTKILEDETAYATAIRTYLFTLTEQSKENAEQAKKDAIEALKRTGVVNDNGTAKDKIVSWE